MRYKEIGIGMGRTLRLEKYVFVRPEAWLLAELGPDEDPDIARAEMRKDLDLVLDELEEVEAHKLGFVKDNDGKYFKLEIED